MNLDKRVWFRMVCTANGLTPTDYQLEQLNLYVQLLLEWNKKINLISRKDEENVWTYHILHSASLLFKARLDKDCKIVDIGTGGGLPGIPLKILRPDLSMLCLDSTGKKAKAVSQMASDLNLSNVTTVWGRAEEIGKQTEYFQKFDFAVARAVAPLIDLVEWSKNFLKREKSLTAPANDYNEKMINASPPALLTFKGGDLTQEIEFAKQGTPKIKIEIINITLAGSEQLIASDKKIVIVHL
jgi:16S rRNA (guanine527-N7)-methyltransferase